MRERESVRVCVCVLHVCYVCGLVWYLSSEALRVAAWGVSHGVFGVDRQ